MSSVDELGDHNAASPEVYNMRLRDEGEKRTREILNFYIDSTERDTKIFRGGDAPIHSSLCIWQNISDYRDIRRRAREYLGLKTREEDDRMARVTECLSFVHLLDLEKSSFPYAEIKEPEARDRKGR